MTIDRNLLVPFRQHTLTECNRIIQQASGVPEDWHPAARSMQPSPYEEWIDACLNAATKRLTKWEEDFLLSIQDQLNRTGSLSQKQIDILERIYTEKV